MMGGRITDPGANARVRSTTRVQGTILGEDAGHRIWLAHRRTPGGPLWPKEPRIDPAADGSFSVVVYEGGTPGPITISLLAVDEKTDRLFEEWLREGHNTGSYPGLMPNELSAQELDSVQVVYDPRKPVRMFVSYSHKDEPFLQQLEESLAALKRSGAVETWHDHQITAGAPVAREIAHALLQADVMLLLVSPSFIASDYCYQQELVMALRRHHDGDLRIIPIIVRAVDWERSLFRDLKALPQDGRPIASWQHRDEAWLDVAKEIRVLVDVIRGPR